MRNCNYVALVYGRGQNLDGTMTIATEESCRQALVDYQSGKVDTIFLAVAESAKNASALLSQMTRFFARHLVKHYDVIILPATPNKREALARCEEWASHIGDSYGHTAIIEIGA